jgi:hypothetical protein
LVRFAEEQATFGIVNRLGLERLRLIRLGHRNDLDRKGGVIHGHELASRVTRRRSTLIGKHNALLLVVWFRGDRGSSDPRGERENAGGEENADAVRPTGRWGEDGAEAILREHGVFGTTRRCHRSAPRCCLVALIALVEGVGNATKRLGTGRCVRG